MKRDAGAVARGPSAQGGGTVAPTQCIRLRQPAAAIRRQTNVGPRHAGAGVLGDIGHVVPTDDALMFREDCARVEGEAP